MENAHEDCSLGCLIEHTSSRERGRSSVAMAQSEGDKTKHSRTFSYKVPGIYFHCAKLWEERAYVQKKEFQYKRDIN